MHIKRQGGAWTESYMEKSKRGEERHMCSRGDTVKPEPKPRDWLFGNRYQGKKNGKD